jgi:hypothetical protein
VKLSELQPQEYELFVDMDGVVADFEKGVSAVMGERLDQERYDRDSKYRSKMWKWVKQHAKEGGTLWEDLPMMPDGQALWNYVKKYDPTVLTAMGNPAYGAEPQKRKWIAEKFGSRVPVIVTRKSDEKAQYAAPNRILIDDREKSIGPWEAAGGIGILHKNTADTIRQLKEMGL